MTIRVRCPSCQGECAVREDVRGKNVRCPRCMGVFQVPPAEVVVPVLLDSAPTPGAPPTEVTAQPPAPAPFLPPHSVTPGTAWDQPPGASQPPSLVLPTRPM